MAKKKNKKKKHTTPEKTKPKTTPEKNYRKDPEKIELMHARIGMGDSLGRRESSGGYPTG